jgi:glycolate oxidase FAD binding subunit
MDHQCHIDGFGPLPVVRPTSVAELGEVVARAASQAAAIYPIGGQTHLGLGNTPIKTGVAVDVRGLDHIIDFPARDMTITVQAGVTMARLQALLASEKLRLPIDVAEAQRATLGGSLAANVSGSRRYGYGTLRDYVIGISAVNDTGQEFKAGGRVVKNVAGYDLCKLLIGALGTLGIITQVTLKVRPLAEEQALLSFGCAADGLDAMLDRLHATRSRPVCIELLNRRAADAIFRRAGTTPPEADWTLVVGYEGNAEAVRWQGQHLIKELGAAEQLEARVGFPAEPLWNALVEGSGLGEAVLAFKASLLPSVVAAFCRGADRDPDRPALQARAGSGIVHGHWTGELIEARAAELRSAWRAEAERGRGSVVVERCPPAWKRSVPVWDALPAGWLMRAVKQQFDPHRIFNPGRFVDGI